MDKCEYAVELKHKGYNCAQSVLCAFADELELSEEDLKKMGAAFGVGMGCMEATCGALIAAGIVRKEGVREPAPEVLWIHGGGYATGMKEMLYMGRGIDLALRHGAVVISPSYTLSYKAPYPAAIEDCYDVLMYIMKDSHMPRSVILHNKYKIQSMHNNHRE